MSKLKLLATIVALSMSSVASFGDSVADFIFDEALLSKLTPHSKLMYKHDLTVPDQSSKPGFKNGAIELTLKDAENGSKEVFLVFVRDGKKQPLAPMPSVGGNPLVMVFLENTARAMADISGGSPFYIRNRLKAALLDEGTQSLERVSIGSQEKDVTRIELSPFEEDPNRARMGHFGDMRVSFYYGSDVPGGIYGLRNFVPDGKGGAFYDEQIFLETVKAGVH